MSNVKYIYLLFFLIYIYSPSNKVLLYSYNFYLFTSFYVISLTNSVSVIVYILLLFMNKKHLEPSALSDNEYFFGIVSTIY